MCEAAGAPSKGVLTLACPIGTNCAKLGIVVAEECKTCLLSRDCSWSPASFKHFPFSGLTREHTEHGPARYALDYDRHAIEAVERTTASSPSLGCGTFPGRTEYARVLDHVLGWDRGRDANVSYVECSGGDQVRAFHGRPMSSDNAKLRQLIPVEEA